MGFELIAFYLVLIIYFFVCLFLILVILGQEGKGGGLSGMVGTAALGETFGFTGAESAMRRWTRNIAILFIVLTVVLTFWGERIGGGSYAKKFTGAIPEGPEAGVPAATQGVPPADTQAMPPVEPGASAPGKAAAPALTPIPAAPAATPAASTATTPAP